MRTVRLLGAIVSLVVATAFAGCGSSGTTGTAGASGSNGAAGAAGAAGTAGAAGSGPVVCAGGVAWTPSVTSACGDCINQNCCPASVGCFGDPTDYCDYCVSGIDASCSADTPFQNLETCISAHCTGCGTFY